MSTVVVLGERFMIHPQLIFKGHNPRNNVFTTGQQSFEIMQDGLRGIFELVADPHPEYSEHPIVTPLGPIEIAYVMNNGLPFIKRGSEPVQIDIGIETRSLKLNKQNFSCAMYVKDQLYYAHCKLVIQEAELIEKKRTVFRISTWDDRLGNPVCVYFDPKTEFWKQIMFEIQLL